MRTIKFRGKRIDNEDWVEGDLVTTLTPNGSMVKCPAIHTTYGTIGTFFVSPQTVRQFTGLKDRKGKEIYEGDILFDYDFDEMVEVEYEELLGAFILDKIPAIGAVNYIGSKETESYCEIIGNIHDNPELLEGGAK